MSGYDVSLQPKISTSETTAVSGRRKRPARSRSPRCARGPAFDSRKLIPQWSGDATKNCPSPVIPRGFFSWRSLPIEVPTPIASAVLSRGESTAILHTRPFTISASTVSLESATASFRAGIASAPKAVVSRMTLHFCRTDSTVAPMRSSPIPSSPRTSSPHEDFCALAPVAAGVDGAAVEAADVVGEEDGDAGAGSLSAAQPSTTSIRTKRRISAPRELEFDEISVLCASVSRSPDRMQSD